MARRPNLDNPLVAWRRALRVLHGAAPRSAPTRSATHRIALFRAVGPTARSCAATILPDNHHRNSTGAHLSRQFFRDRRRTIELLMQLPNLVTPQLAAPATFSSTSSLKRSERRDVVGERAPSLADGERAMS